MTGNYPALVVVDHASYAHASRRDVTVVILSSAGLVEPDREEVADGRLRRYYRLTDEGATVLAEETERRRASAAVAAQRLSARLAGGIA